MAKDYRDRANDGRGKKSFSELDKSRRERKYRGDEGGTGRAEKLEKGQAYRAYKTQLDKVFEGGGLPDALKSKLEESGIGLDAKARKEAAAAIKAASTPKKIKAAYDTYREAHDFPQDEEVLAKLIGLEDEPEIIVEALQTIERLHDEGSLKRGGSLKARIKTAQMTIDDDDVWAACKALLGKL